MKSILRHKAMQTGQITRITLSDELLKSFSTFHAVVLDLKKYVFAFLFVFYLDQVYTFLTGMLLGLIRSCMLTRKVEVDDWRIRMYL